MKIAEATGMERNGVALPEWIRILPLGKVELVDRQEPLEVDAASLEAMVTDFRSRGVDLVIDYEHQSLLSERAPAAGWIKDLEVRADGLWGRVEWTEAAREYLRHREYRYFSPVLRLDLESRRPLKLLHVGLTNVPAIKGLTPLVAKMTGPGAAPGKEKRDMRDRLKQALGLSPEAGEETVGLWVLEAFRDLALALSLPEEATVSQLKGALAALKAGTAGLAEAQEELMRLRARQREAATAQAVDEALRAGKISPAQRAWAYEYCRQDPEGFKTYTARAPKVLPAGEELPRLREDREGGVLLPEELTLCRALNLAPEAYLKARAQSPAN